MIDSCASGRSMSGNQRSIAVNCRSMAAGVAPDANNSVSRRAVATSWKSKYGSRRTSPGRHDQPRRCQRRIIGTGTPSKSASMAGVYNRWTCAGIDQPQPLPKLRLADNLERSALGRLATASPSAPPPAGRRAIARFPRPRPGWPKRRAARSPSRHARAPVAAHPASTYRPGGRRWPPAGLAAMPRRPDQKWWRTRGWLHPKLAGVIRRRGVCVTGSVWQRREDVSNRGPINRRSRQFECTNVDNSATAINRAWPPQAS